MRILHAVFVVVVFFAATPFASKAAERADIEAFLEVTGFDVALESIKLSAGSAPAMIGLDEEDFGFQWRDMTARVFDVDTMHDLAIDLLEQTLSDNLLEHAMTFYASDLGARLVVAENDSHLEEDDDLKTEVGQAILEGLDRLDSPRRGYFERMNAAIDSAGTAARSIQEVQIRFLMAAAGAGVIELQMDEPDLRARMEGDKEALEAAITISALEGAAYTYQAFSDEDVLAYAEALEHPDMRAVYELMNAVQFEIMANRFELLAQEMSNIQPSQEL